MVKVKSIIEVGKVDKPNARKVRIVHLSDTHLHHEAYLQDLPDGDILIHSGDFCKTGWNRLVKRPGYESHIQNMISFFSRVPHRHKILVAGNHDMAIVGKTQEEVERLIPGVNYLLDSEVTLEGIKFHGSPWTSYKFSSYNRAFVKKWGKFEHHWDAIADDTDVVVTHMPPQGIRDLGSTHFSFLTDWRSETCEICSEHHRKLFHMGCPKLKATLLNRVRPTLHCFGHMHGSAGVEQVDGTLFSNAALSIHVFDYYL